MVGVQGVGGVPEPQPDRSSGVRNRREDEARAGDAARRDGVVISDEAQEAAEVARYVELAKDEPDVREERVAEARAALERGDHQNPTVIQRIAETLERVL